MKKLFAFGFTLMLMTNQVHAGFISIITGADMVGMEVTVTYESGLFETKTWEMESLGNGLIDTLNLETAIGGVTGDGFILKQQGDSLGNLDNNGTVGNSSDDTFFGLWTLTNTSSETITELFVNAIAGNVVFDTLFNTGAANGSGLGRAFDSPISGPTAVYSDLYLDELYGAMTVTLSLESDASITFFADTDLVAVSTPASLSIMLLALCGLTLRRKKFLRELK